jgi:hypothetical protein
MLWLVEEGLPDLGEKPQKISNIMKLLAAREPATDKTYAILALNV